MCYKCNVIAKKTNGEQLSNWVASSSRKQVLLLCQRDRRREQGAQGLCWFWQAGLQPVCIRAGHTWQWCSQKQRERRRNASPSNLHPLFSISWTHPEAIRHGSQPENTAACWAQLPWDIENGRKAKNGSGGNSPMTATCGMLPDTRLVLSWGVNGSMSSLSLGSRSLVVLFPLSLFLALIF